MSVATASIIVGGLASSLYIAGRALDTDGTAQRASADQVLDKFVADVEQALSFSERSANAVTFTVPSRDGDNEPDTIRYAWSGTLGDPLTYEYNGSAAETIAADVQIFNLASMTRLMEATVIPPAEGGGKLLLVVADPASPSAQETARQSLIESWGYTVTLIDDGDSQANFDTAVAENDVAYISTTISSNSLGTKLANVTIGVVNEEGEQVDELGFSPDKLFKTNHEMEVIDNSHYITETFPTGFLSFVSSDQSVHMLNGWISEGIQTLGQTLNIGAQYNPSLAVFDVGDALYGGAGTAIGRRVQLPWGGGTFDINALTGDGRTIMRRAIEWGAGANGGGAAHLLLLVADANNPTVEETGRKTLLESWSYAVTLATASEPQSVYDTYPDNFDVVYVPSSVSYLDVASKLKLLPIGVVNEVTGLTSYLGFTSGSSGFTGASMETVDNTHEITSPFSVGNLAIMTSSQSLRRFVNTMGPGFRTLSTSPASSDPMMMTLDTGDELLWGGNAPDRRVMLPWGNSTTFDANNLTADGKTIMRRAIEWASAPSEAGLIAHWKLDETSGTTAVDSVGGNDGTLVNGPVWSTGKLDGCLDFDGNNDYVVAGSLNPRSYDDCTISAWYKSTDTTVSDDEYIFEHNDNFAEEVTFGPTDDGTGDRLRFGFSHGGSGTWDPHYGTSDIVDNKWHHVVGVRSAGRIQLYVDGVLETDEADAHAGQTITIDGVGPFIGDLPGNTEQVHGKLDDVRLYGLALSAAEIADLFTAGGGPAPDGNFGNESVFASSQSSVRRKQIATQVTLPTAGTITSITAYVGGRNRNVRYAIYTDAAGEPGNLIAETDNATSQNSMTWLTIDLPDTPLAAGTYWLALSFHDNAQKYHYESGGQTRYNDNRATDNGYTASWGSSSFSDTRKISIYGTFTPTP